MMMRRRHHPPTSSSSTPPVPTSHDVLPQLHPTNRQRSDHKQHLQLGVLLVVLVIIVVVIIELIIQNNGIHHPSINHVYIAGYKILVNNSSGGGVSSSFVEADIPVDPIIRIPMQEYANEQPQRVELRNWEFGTRKRLRRIGERALLQYGIQIRQLMALSQRIGSSNGSTDDDGVVHQFQQQLVRMAPWLKKESLPSSSSSSKDSTVKIWPFQKSSTSASSTTTNTKKDAAVVLCFRDRQLKYADNLIWTIRMVHKSKIPVRVVYRGNRDLSQLSRDVLTEKYFIGAGVGGLQFIDLAAIFNFTNGDDNDGDDDDDIKGWNLKAFAMLAVPESQVLLLDVDVMLLQSPEVFFQQDGYKQKGALFFHDRSHREHLWTPRQFLLAMQPLQLSTTAQQVLTHGGLMNEHVQEAGVVVLNKDRRFRGLWTACFILGRSDVRQFIQRDMVYGDKEIYFTAFETVQEPYAFATYYPGTIGNIVTDFHGNDIDWSTTRDKQQISDLDSNMALCGRMLHFDDRGIPLWSNGGYYTREDDRTADSTVAGQGLKPILFADGGMAVVEDGTGGGKEHNQQWLFHPGLAVLCLYPNIRNIRTVPEDISKKGTMAVEHYIRILNETADDVIVRKH